MLPHNFPRADCHCHTLFSDGTLSPVALLDLAKEKGLTGLSITDHDTLDAYETALPYAKSLNIDMVSGIEISTELNNTSIHVLGFAFNLQHQGLIDFCHTLQTHRDERNLEILHKLQERNMILTLEEIKTRFPHGTIGRPHIAYMLTQKGYVKTPEQAFDRYLGDDRPCYVKGMLISVEEAIDLIHQAGGYAIIAHPHYIQPKRLIHTLSNMPFDGIEGYYGRLTPAQERPWLTLANQKNWIVTGGSDYHGEAKPHAILGTSWTPHETFSLFRSRFISHTE